MQELQAVAETVLVPLQLVLAMLGMGATLSLKDFAAVIKQPKGLFLGLTLQWIYVPCIAYAMGIGFGLDAGWAVGLILVAAVPGGATSNLLTFLGKGNVALSIAVTTASTIGCVVTVPVVLRIFASEHLPATFDFPTLRIFRDIGLYLLAPLVVGMVAYRWNSTRAAVLSKWAIRLSVASIVVIATAALGSGRIEPLSYGLFSPGMIIVFGLISDAFGSTDRTRARLRRPRHAGALDRGGRAQHRDRSAARAVLLSRRGRAGTRPLHVSLLLRPLAALRAADALSWSQGKQPCPLPSAQAMTRERPIFDAFPSLRLPWSELGDFPTPLQSLAPVADALGVDADAWVKRDDLSSDVYGGNKVRTLEVLFADALEQGATHIISTGAFGTNHGAATVLHAPRVGLEPGLLVFPQPPSKTALANFDVLTHANAELTTMAHWSGLPFRMSFARMRERLRGRNTYVMVPGGATPLGALGYVNAALELAHQVDAGVCPAPEAIVLAVGSTCTSAGLLLGTRIAARMGLGWTQAPKVVSVRVTPWPVTSPVMITRLAARASELLEKLTGEHAIGYSELREGLEVDAQRARSRVRLSDLGRPRSDPSLRRDRPTSRADARHDLQRESGSIVDPSHASSERISRADLGFSGAPSRLHPCPKWPATPT